ncbi:MULTISPECIES: LysR family transcriptional regulator [unclassified Pseudoalteromonas]|uniref:LysR family transcriptional regulator n=1 Tax=unclassified Pseudoalteromonas TaxID=194690 RepID=UPI0015FCE4A0|nr:MULTISPECIES: LysR family transcriptional regulator [unclassified Pseudoalteromonas]MBB1379295.1 LysR family transcriptional regulator [Pseudoalteromonas sp. SR43-2]MBB1455645.1 LysR family transcriptional regulator [Pseudoalteromonas sp. SG43-5]|tara:strand:+ start:12774 stop:13679 length:906 start_codon:yes stop_codon:yes gene_type:complete
MVGASELAIFAIVVEENSFSQAALKMGLSKTAVSKKVSALESKLNTQLLYRTTRKLSLTDAGKLLFEHAKGINQQANDAFNAVNELSLEVSGHIVMSVPTISGELLLADLVAKFCKKYPKVTIELRLENKLVDLVDEGVDLAIRTAVLTDSSLIAVPLLESNWVVCASPKYLADAEAIVDINSLKKHNCLCYDLQANGSNEWRFTLNEGLTSIIVNGSMSSNNALSLKKAALNNVGLIYVPKCSVYEELKSGKLVQVLKNYETRSLGVFAVYPYTRHKPEKITLLIDDIKQAYLSLKHIFS